MGIFFLHLFCARRGDGSQLVTLQEEEEEEEEKTKNKKKKQRSCFMETLFLCEES